MPARIKILFSKRLSSPYSVSNQPEKVNKLVWAINVRSARLIWKISNKKRDKIKLYTALSLRVGRVTAVSFPAKPEQSTLKTCQFPVEIFSVLVTLINAVLF